MSNSIEIPDSDDDIPEEFEESIDSKFILDNSEPTPAKQARLSVSSTAELYTDKTLSSSSDTNKAQSRHRARKTQHAIRDAAEIEIQFETIPDDEGEQFNDSTSSDNLAIDDMLDSEEVEEIVQRIANERVRCNFLLATYQLPDINFTLNTHIDALKLQFIERLRNRKERKKSVNESNKVTKTTTNLTNIVNKKNR